MSILIRGGTVVTMNPKREVLAADVRTKKSWRSESVRRADYWHGCPLEAFFVR